MVELGGWSNNELIAALVGAAVGALIAVVGMRFARATEQKKLTLELFVERIWDKDYILCLQRLTSFARFIEGATFDEFMTATAESLAQSHATNVSQAAASTAPASPQSTGAASAGASAVAIATAGPGPFETPLDVVRSIMNFYEIIAIGIRDQILDEAICKRYIYGEFLQNWRACRSIIDQIRVRANNDRIYKEVENLAKRWARIPPRAESVFLMYLRGWY